MPKVTLVDGREVDFGERAKVDKQSYIDADGTLVVKFAFLNGEIREFRMAATDTLLARAALHGLNQKFGDSFSGVKDVEDMILSFEDVADTLSKGEWTEKRGDGVAGTSVLARALMEVFGKSKDEIRAFLTPLSAGEKQALRKAPGVAEVVARLEAEKVKDVDTSGLLAKLQAAA